MKRARPSDAGASSASSSLSAAAAASSLGHPAPGSAAASAAASSVIVQFCPMGADPGAGGAGAAAASSASSFASSTAPTTPPVDLPLDVTTDQLNALLAKLLDDKTDTPYAFYVNDEEVVGTLRAALERARVTTEATARIRYQPLSVFQVLPVTRCTDSLPGHTDAVLHVSFSPDGSTLASGGGDAMVRFWDVGTCTPRSAVKGHAHHVLCTAWSPDGRLFASADKAGEVRVWDAATGKPHCAPLKGHKSWVTSLAWEPLHLSTDVSGGCALLASSSHDGTVRVWNVRTGAVQFTVSGHKDSIESVRWGGGGHLYTASRDRTIMVWSVGEGGAKGHAAHVRTLTGHGHRINALALNTDYLIRTGAFDPAEAARGAGAEEDAPTSGPGAIEAARARYRKGLAAMGGSELLVSCSDDFTLFLWRPHEAPAATPTRMTGHQQAVNHISFSPDGRYIASASFDKKVKLWDGRTGKFLHSFAGHVGPVYQVCWSADSRLFATASRDSTVKVWPARVGHAGGPAKPVALHTLSGHADEVFALDWSPTGEILASGGRDRVIKFWRH